MEIVLTVYLTVKNFPPGLYQGLSIPAEIMDPDLTSLWHSHHHLQPTENTRQRFFQGYL